MKLYISDPHFFQERFDENLDKRNFPDVRTMNQYMIDQWNKKVRGGDMIIVLGDLFDTKVPEEVNAVLNRLSGRIYLIEGNHDVRWLKKEGVNLNRFEWIKNYAEFSDGNNMVVASHYPTFSYNHQYVLTTDKKPRTYMLYGHVHNSHDEVLINQFQELTRKTVLKGSVADRTIPCNMINCFCKFSDYTPLSLKEWIELDAHRRAEMTPPVNQVIPDEF